MIDQAAQTYREIQDALCEALSAVDGARFITDVWDRPEGGGGETRVIEDGTHLERAAVLHSDVRGEPPSSLPHSVTEGSNSFRATGVSAIVHPRNPNAPTAHGNLRCFELDNGNGWFGGGFDLSPYYLYEEDAVEFHGGLRRVCGRHEAADYPTWKKACDDYFHLPHRGEARGVGGIFFDHVTAPGMLECQRELGHIFGETYRTILERRIDTPFGAAEEEWMLIRRGRYAEFNLVWDRGTRFGLETNGRTESILSSLPPRARWVYRHEPNRGSPEKNLLDLLRGEPRDW